MCKKKKQYIDKNEMKKAQEIRTHNIIGEKCKNIL